MFVIVKRIMKIRFDAIKYKMYKLNLVQLGCETPIKWASKPFLILKRHEEEYHQ